MEKFTPPPPYEAPSVTTQPYTGDQPIQGIPELGVKPVRLVCPYCGILVETRTQVRPSTKTHICALFCCLTVILIPCACSAYCAGVYFTVDHFCPNCDKHFGTFQSQLCIQR